MEIIILGTGCAKCITTYEAVKKVIEENGLDANLTKQEDILEIMKYNVMSLPAIVIDGIVKIKGHVPSEKEIRKVLGV
ncbi:MAG TPA: thioredoxin family protein [Candidatus Cloacimonadota bacterium]|nr:thioredoxin family protein [Candidatus Cloacimonadales bacterium]HOQ79646.1 thioredoxin family protein [Candidatus Cloacimonadota bacterium]HPK40814.1 thioredoxin family protein [Candidatus Cloacimonadota bacterium]HPY96707.1 thioredoxin family protein [Candidatus Cloacimonadota bacterium]HQB41302.1 thioredoxin family protein [Candidatus Cloacimonadota bacterium]